MYVSNISAVLINVHMIVDWKCVYQGTFLLPEDIHSSSKIK